MKKNVTLKNTLNSMAKMGRMIPRSINESMDYNGLDEMDELGMDDDIANQEGEAMPEEEPVEELGGDEKLPQEEPEVEAPHSANAGVQSVPKELRSKVAKFVDNIRKMALKGMSELADYPDSVEYQTLKKLWQQTDKKPENQQTKTL